MQHHKGPQSLWSSTSVFVLLRFHPKTKAFSRICQKVATDQWSLILNHYRSTKWRDIGATRQSSWKGLTLFYVLWLDSLSLYQFHDILVSFEVEELCAHWQVWKMQDPDGNSSHISHYGLRLSPGSLSGTDGQWWSWIYEEAKRWWCKEKTNSLYIKLMNKQ